MTPISAAPKLVWDNILTLPYYQPGKPIEEVERELGITGIIKLASNENPLGPSPKAIEVIHKMATEVHRYPDATAHFLKQKMSAKLELAPEQIGFGNGADEIITFIAAAFIHPGDEALVPTPTFIRYETCVQMMGGKPINIPLKDWKLDLEALKENINDRTKMIFLCNPNNPTGTIVERKELEEFLSHVPKHIIIVFDEAYYEYVTAKEYPDTLSYLKNSDRRIIILRTFSKIYGLAGLRIGYGLTTEELADVLKLVRPPFNASAIAQAAAAAAIDDTEHVEKSRSINTEGKNYICAAFDKLGIDYAPSESNFIFFDSERDGVEVFNGMLHKGVIIRPLTVDGKKQYLRVSIGTMDENKRFVDTFEEVLKEVPKLEA